MENIIIFTYTNSKGETRERIIKPLRGNDDFIQGIDLSQHQTKTFRVGGIVNDEIILRDTGEVLSVRAFTAQLPIFEPTPPQSRKPYSKDNSIHFTGFADTRKKELQELAQQADFAVVQSVINGLNYLIYNEKRQKPSAKKLEQAATIGAKILTESDFLQLLESK